MKILINACNWFFGLFSLFTGLLVLPSIPLLGILMMLLGIVILPITTELLSKKTGIDFSGYLKGMIASALLITSGIVATLQKEKLDHAASELGGFPDISHYRHARSVGYETYAEYQDYLTYQRMFEEAKKQAVEENLCRQNLSCWADRHLLVATQACRGRLETIKSSYHWTEEINTLLFPRYRWHDPGRATLTYTGDKLQFQDPSGEWINMAYECDFDPAAKTVLHVRARAGSLQK